MIVNSFKFFSNLDEELIKYYHLNDLVFFDIEATGFYERKDWVFAISFYTLVDGYGVGETLICESINDEKKLIEHFIKNINGKILCSYNGKAFDEPFLKKRASIYRIPFPMVIRHKDLYRELRPYQNGLKLKSLSLKELEKVLSINREEEISAMDCVYLYRDYLEEPSDKILNKIINYNFNDVKSLPHIFNLLRDVREKEIVRGDAIDGEKKQEIVDLCEYNNIHLEEEVYRNISKKAGARILFKLQTKGISKKEIEDIINNSY